MSECELMPVWRGDSWRDDYRAPEPVIAPLLTREQINWNARVSDARILACVAVNPCPVTAIAQQCQVPYQRAYNAIQRLVRQGKVKVTRSETQGLGRPAWRYQAQEKRRTTTKKNEILLREGEFREPFDGSVLPRPPSDSHADGSLRTNE